MTLIERSEKLKKNLSELRQLTNDDQRFQHFIQREEQLKNALHILGSLGDVASNLRIRGMELNELSATAIGFKKAAIKVAEEFDSERGSILENDVIDCFWRPLKSMPEKVYKVIHEVWKSYVKSMIPEIQEDVLEVLERVPGFEDHVQRVRLPLNNLRNMERTLPQNHEDITRVDEYVSQILSAWQNIGGEGIPQQVLIFLKDVHSGGVALGNLSPTVIQWLKEQSLINSFLVIGRR